MKIENPLFVPRIVASKVFGNIYIVKTFHVTRFGTLLDIPNIRIRIPISQMVAWWRILKSAVMFQSISTEVCRLYKHAQSAPGESPPVQVKVLYIETTDLLDTRRLPLVSSMIVLIQNAWPGLHRVVGLRRVQVSSAHCTQISAGPGRTETFLQSFGN